ncbi:uncharacterized protein C8Q71DRAFT_891830 [Rhodofomes roseus]|uniref:Uncharacterized protein n=1 Tax=Rhodofomes roseus TaxID=34475 RepID=A0ABQ8JXV1_9APHY|nr:uncharacterized protein C8Q71DRAFT_891830 [Rhodofomes roseus]KAH9828764.1 hypothetical protein C8Q71DRAFT_891830 [Rhodofomes roseus]
MASRLLLTLGAVAVCGALNDEASASQSSPPELPTRTESFQQQVKLEPPIMFFLQSPQRCGMPLQHALTGQSANLVDRDDLMFTNRGPSISIRLMWPGYTPWSRQIPTRDFGMAPQPITKSTLAKSVAKVVRQFIEEAGTCHWHTEEDADLAWRVGTGHIQLQDLSLIGLQHVSMSSWQAYVALLPGRVQAI